MSKKHIVWADDEIHLLEPHIIFMEERGYKMTPVNSGEDAINVCKKEIVDLLLIDEMMTGLDGIETINIIKKNNPEIPIIMVTKNEEEWLMEEAIGSYISNYLTKPVNPSQILIACKNILENTKIHEDRILKDFIQYINKISIDPPKMNIPDDWFRIYDEICDWSLKLDDISDSNISDMFYNQKNNFNIEFSNYVERNYKNWMLKKNTPPILSHNVFDTSISPILKQNRKLVFIIIDCFKMEQWKKISTIFYEDYTLEEKYHFSILPSATPFARNAIFSGLLPLELKKNNPDLWKAMFIEKKMNAYEKELFQIQLDNKGFNKTSNNYIKISNYNEGKKFINRINDFKNLDILNIVVNFVDILGHSRSESNILKELLPNESAYRQAIYNWFSKSWLNKAIKIFHDWDVDIVITSDHGNTLVNKPVLVKADQTASTGVRYKYGRNLRLDQKNILKINKPEDFMLPSFGLNTQYLIAKDFNYFIYKNDYHRYVNMYKNSYQHGGITMDEIIVPLIHMKKK